MKLLLYISIVLLLLSCNSKPNFNCKSTNSDWEIIKKQMSLEDIMLANIVKLKIKNEIFKFREIVNEKEFDLAISNSNYSKDSSKLISSIIIKDKLDKYYSHSDCPDYRYGFNSHILVGYKSSKNKWRFYIYNKLHYVSFYSPKEISLKMKKYLEVDLKYSTLEVLNKNKTKSSDFVYDYERINSNANESKFWTSIFWKKGNSLDGFYNFELLNLPTSRNVNGYFLDTISYKFI